MRNKFTEYPWSGIEDDNVPPRAKRPELGIAQNDDFFDDADTEPNGAFPEAATFDDGDPTQPELAQVRADDSMEFTPGSIPPPIPGTTGRQVPPPLPTEAMRTTPPPPLPPEAIPVYTIDELKGRQLPPENPIAEADREVEEAFNRMQIAGPVSELPQPAESMRLEDHFAKQEHSQVQHELDNAQFDIGDSVSSIDFPEPTVQNLLSKEQGIATRAPEFQKMYDQLGTPQAPSEEFAQMYAKLPKSNQQVLSFDQRFQQEEAERLREYQLLQAKTLTQDLKNKYGITFNEDGTVPKGFLGRNLKKYNALSDSEVKNINQLFEQKKQVEALVEQPPQTTLGKLRNSRFGKLLFGVGTAAALTAAAESQSRQYQNQQDIQNQAAIEANRLNQGYNPTVSGPINPLGTDVARVHTPDSLQSQMLSSQPDVPHIPVRTIDMPEATMDITQAPDIQVGKRFPFDMFSQSNSAEFGDTVKTEFDNYTWGENGVVVEVSTANDPNVIGSSSVEHNNVYVIENGVVKNVLEGQGDQYTRQQLDAIQSARDYVERKAREAQVRNIGRTSKEAQADILAGSVQQDAFDNLPAMPVTDTAAQARQQNNQPTFSPRLSPSLSQEGTPLSAQEPLRTGLADEPDYEPGILAQLAEEADTPEYDPMDVVKNRKPAVEKAAGKSQPEFKPSQADNDLDRKDRYRKMREQARDTIEKMNAGSTNE